jgi:phosphate transport system protein
MNVIRVRLASMSNLMTAMFKDAVRALTLHDQELAKSVLGRDEAVDDLETELEALCLKFLALYAPKAFELRYVAAATRVAADMERMADHASALSREVLARHLRPLAAALPDFKRMTDLTESMMTDAVDAFFRIDGSRHSVLAERDLEVGRLQRALTADLIGLISSDPDVALEAVTLIGVARRIERTADHAKNIAALVPYVASGEVIRRGRKAGREATENAPAAD